MEIQGCYTQAVLADPVYSQKYLGVIKEVPVHLSCIIGSHHCSICRGQHREVEYKIGQIVESETDCEYDEIRCRVGAYSSLSYAADWLVIFEPFMEPIRLDVNRYKLRVGLVKDIKALCGFSPDHPVKEITEGVLYYRPNRDSGTLHPACSVEEVERMFPGWYKPSLRFRKEEGRFIYQPI